MKRTFIVIHVLQLDYESAETTFFKVSLSNLSTINLNKLLRLTNVERDLLGYLLMNCLRILASIQLMGRNIEGKFDDFQSHVEFDSNVAYISRSNGEIYCIYKVTRRKLYPIMTNIKNNYESLAVAVGCYTFIL